MNRSSFLKKLGLGIGGIALGGSIVKEIVDTPGINGEVFKLTYSNGLFDPNDIVTLTFNGKTYWYSREEDLKQHEFRLKLEQDMFDNFRPFKY